MMKIVEKIKEKTSSDKKSDNAITQKNIEESREEILAKGKKFKYPFQYAKHRLMINAILIGLVAVGTFVAIGAYQLYQAQNTSEVMYRFTRTLPLSVADVDGVKVRFSDYLMLYRSSVASIERQQGEFDDSDASREQKEHYKRQALYAAEDYSFAMAKLAEVGKAVTEEEIDAVIEEHKIIDGEKRSNEAFEGIIRDNFGLSMKEYRRLIALSLAKKKASIEFDTDAKETIGEIAEKAAKDGDFVKIFAEYAENGMVVYEEVDDVNATNLDNGRATKAAELEKVGDISEIFASKNGDCYYIVKLTAKDEDGTLSYASISVRFDWLDGEMSKLREEGKVHEKISLNGGVGIEPEGDGAEDEEAKNDGEATGD